MPKADQFKALPAPWDRIFSLGTRLFVWALLIGIIYILRPFFLLIFLTFVFGYVQAHMTDGLAHRFKGRALRVVLVFLVFLGAIIGTGYFMGPKLNGQAQSFIAKYPQYMEDADNAIYNTAEEFEPVRRWVLENAKASEEKSGTNGKTETDPKKDNAAAAKQDPLPEKIPPESRRPIMQPLVTTLLGFGGDDAEPVKDGLKQTIAVLRETLQTVLGIGSAFLLSLLFSFLIVLDLPKLTRGVTGLANTRVGFIYDEVADNIHNFGRVLGRALEAQLFIAIVNTILTGIGIYFMGLENVVFLCTVVFFCSFIPVAGVFLSSAPICLMALQTSGLQLMMIAIGVILLVHFIEAYFLNPKIFGHHLRMNAVLVLIVLTVAGKLFGVWGLVLGLPITNYIFAHAIRYFKDEKVPEPVAVPSDTDRPSPPAQPRGKPQEKFTPQR